MRLKVKDVMTSDPVTVRPDATFREVAEQLIEHDIGGVPVVDDEGVVVGMITETDLVTKPAYGHEPSGVKGVVHALFHGERPTWTAKSGGLSAKDIMSTPPVTTTPWDDLEAVGRRLLKHRIGRLPVVADGRLVGIVSRRDLVLQYDRTDSEISVDVDKAIHDPLLSESDPRVTFSVEDGVVALNGTVRYPHDVASLEALVAGIPGVVAVRSVVTSSNDEPRPGPGAGYPDEYTPRY